MARGRGEGVMDMEELRLGMVGFSAGNGHPYSWSAIFNGYEPDAMRDCGFPAIPAYLAEHRFPEDAIEGARVCCIWCPDEARARHVAEASRIKQVCARPEDLIGQVDAVLLARDDVESPERRALIDLFLDAGLPLFVDKPLALSRHEAQALLDRQQWPGQIFSGSALGHAPELDELRGDPLLDEVHYLEGVAPKSWMHYAVHAIDPALSLIGPQGDVEHAVVSRAAHSHVVTVRWASGLQATFTTLTDTPTRILLRLHGPGGPRELRFLDTFGAFRASLLAYVEQVRQRCPHPSQALLLPVVEVIEHGLAETA
ncbi:MAG: hypothetical protein D6786_03330 [Gammaproteobacteria bacterium]|nr:MAG: hypothetical protein D6786_03330 [Gammaproteobacteria bacterium]